MAPKKQRAPYTKGIQGSQGLPWAIKAPQTALLAEQAGFEPAVGLTPRTLSRRVT